MTEKFPFVIGEAPEGYKWIGCRLAKIDPKDCHVRSYDEMKDYIINKVNPEYFARFVEEAKNKEAERKKKTGKVKEFKESPENK